MPKRARGLFLIILFTLFALGLPLIAEAGNNVWTTGAPLLGSTTAVAVDPTNGNIVYAGVSGGVWKSTDNGATWVLLPTAGIPDAFNIRTLAIDPTNPQVVYVGTAKGVGKSIDGGNTWVVGNGGIGSNPDASSIAIDPTNPNILYRGEGNFGNIGVRKSDDGGLNWGTLNAGLPVATSQARVWALAIDPSNPLTVYAATADAGVYKSTDGGGTWNPINTGLAGLDLLVYSLILDPNNPQTLYAGVRGPGHLFKSTNGGANWVQMSSGLTSLIQQLAIDRTTGALYAGQAGGGVFTSTDGGANWGAMNDGLPAGPSRGGWVGAIAFSPLSHTLHIGTAGGEYDFTSAPAIPDIAVEPASLDFGEVPVGSPATRTLTVHNTGTSDLIVSDITDPFFSISGTSFIVTPGNSHDVVVTFIPDEPGPVSDVLRIHSNDPDHPVVDVPATGVGVARNILQAMDAVVGPGEQAVVRLKLHNLDPVAGLQFRVATIENEGPSSHAHLIGVLNNLPGFEVITSEQGNETLLLIVSLQGAVIPPGWTEIAELVYDIDETTPFGTAIDVPILQNTTILSDPDGNPLQHAVLGGRILVGRRGDPNNDGKIDVLDVVTLINVILGRHQIVLGSDEYLRADINGDGMVDILDVVRLLNIVLGRAVAKPVAGPTSPVQMAFGDPQASPTGPSLLPIQAQFDGAVAGLQLTLRYDPTTLTLGPVQPTDALAGLTVDSQAAAGTLTVLIYSPEGRVLHVSGLKTLLTLPVTGTGTVELTQALVADAQAARVPTTITTGTAKVAPVPTAWGLKPAQPNPFNPTTRLAYDVPQAGHIVLAVYNLLGQEVIRLVDGMQQPGRYVVSWDGRSGQGLSVASGVYLYRLTASAGFSQTKRMTLLK